MRSHCKGKSLIIVRNKIDKSTIDFTSHLSSLVNQLSTLEPQLISISAKTGENMEALESAIYQAAGLPTLSECDVIVTNARHYESLVCAHASLQRVIDGLHSQLSGDLLAEDLRLTLSHLGDITGGQITPQETLNNIFSQFCVGK